MKVVVAIPYTPWPVRKGTNRLILNLLEGLSAEHKTVLVTMVEEKWELEKVKEIEGERLKVHAMLAPHRRGQAAKLYHKLKNLSLSLCCGIPQEVSYVAPRPYLELVARTALDTGADLILASYWHLYRLPEYVERARPVLITHDVDFLVFRERLRFIRGSLSRFLVSRRARLLERVERKAYERFPVILTVTPLDAEVLRSQGLGGEKLIEPLPLALDLGRFDGSSYGRRENVVLFLGSFHADFNRDAFFWFNDEVLPELGRRIGGIKLEVVGFGVDGEIRGRAHRSVEFVGGVEDIRPYLGTCSLMVLPLRFAGGVRIRMLEAAAMGTPVVSTTVGVRGMGLTEGEHYLRGDTPEEMLSAIGSILGSRGEAERLSRNVRRWAEENISMDDYPARLTRLLENIVEN